MGLADVILGVKITRTQSGLVLSQPYYVDKILEKFNGNDSNVARTPLDTTLAKNRSEPVNQLEYSRIIGSLMYLMSCTRPDLAYAVSKLSRYTSNPSSIPWNCIIRLLRYLRYTREYGLHYNRYPAVIEGHCDANWISDTNDSRATSGFVFTLGGAAISWKSSKQTASVQVRQYAVAASDWLTPGTDRESVTNTGLGPHCAPLLIEFMIVK
ncbi:secreted RxLR effector protein 161-like [Helianthus annuus]|uniref:secreted RxLR effector protein 161-like n=1 Tax=Helianthus annuus TaxID=4232 RepID=UPI001652DA72|nr:secreted RxLR effector protein 161-like [Helianthus annuus]